MPEQSTIRPGISLKNDDYLILVFYAKSSALYDINRILASPLTPRQVQLPFIPNAIRQIQVNQRLVRNPAGRGLLLEIRDDIRVQIDGDLVFQLLGIGIGSGVGKIIFFSHFRHLFQT